MNITALETRQRGTSGLQRQYYAIFHTLREIYYFFMPIVLTNWRPLHINGAVFKLG
jgi:hypothetical protein